MREIKITADELISSLLVLSERKQVCLLDSCGVSHQDSHLLIAGIEPVETFNISRENPLETLKILDEKLSRFDLAHIFTISYDFGLKLETIAPREKICAAFLEPDIFLAAFDCLVIHDYRTTQTFLVGNAKKFDETEWLLFNSVNFESSKPAETSKVASNFTQREYVAAVEEVQEFIRRGDTYQTNLTQQIRVEMPENLTAQKIFWSLRKSHPAPFAAFLKRADDFVVSISPERFFKVRRSKIKNQGSKISTSPIKGTRRRGATETEDLLLSAELLQSEKDRAENVMIVDLLRNDLGRICEFGTIKVEKLCDLETHPTLFHLVSTVSGELRENVNFSDIIKAVFPCGSITGAPKIRTMRIIDRIETAARGLSMGAIGYSIQNPEFKIQNSVDLNVAIRTMVVRGSKAIFNVGGGIVIDSEPADEYAESLLKARALLNAVGGNWQ